VKPEEKTPGVVPRSNLLKTIIALRVECDPNRNLIDRVAVLFCPNEAVGFTD
jgi:hypothetical protein